MKKLLLIGLWELMVMGLWGCDYFNSRELKPGVSTASDVRRRFGPPQQVWPNENGSVTCEYSRQPKGAECYMITLDANQVVQQVAQVLNEKNFARIQPGMRIDEVKRILVSPGSVQRFVLKANEEVWGWLIDPGNLNDRVYFSVTFSSDGRVLTTGRYTETRR